MSLNYTELDESQLEFVTVGEAADVPNGERLFVEIDDLNIVVFNIAGRHFAIADLCTHDNGPLGEGEFDAAAPYEVDCPRHGAKFDVRSGKAVKLPAIVDIPAYPVRVKDGSLEVGIPR